MLSQDRICDYIDVISKSAISVVVYSNKAAASQIFELHNTRGVLLTEIEKVKALLMKYVYLHNGDADVTVIQKSFAKVFELEEKAADVSFRGEMSLDDILAHHLRAVDDGGKQESYSQPQSVEGDNGCVAYVRKRLATFVDNKNEGVIYAKSLANELAKTMHIVCNIFVAQDALDPLIGDVILLDQRRSMIFLLRYFRALDFITEHPNHKLLKRWESFLFLWDCHDVFYNMKSGKKDSFSEIFDGIGKGHTQVSDLLAGYYSGKINFAYRDYSIRRSNGEGENILITGLAEVFLDYIARNEDSLLHRAYNWGHWHSRYKYMLYKYEIEMTDEQTIPKATARIALRDLFKNSNVTLDHIVPHELEWKELSKNGAHDNNLEPDDEMQAEAIWKEICKSIDGIGNLVLLSHSDNASLQNIAPSKRASEYRRFKLESISYSEVATWKCPSDWSDADRDPWQVRIQERGARILTMVKNYVTDDETWQA